MSRGQVKARNISLAVLRSHPYYNLSLCDFHMNPFSVSRNGNTFYNWTNTRLDSSKINEYLDSDFMSVENRLKNGSRIN